MYPKSLLYIQENKNGVKYLDYQLPWCKSHNKHGINALCSLKYSIKGIMVKCHGSFIYDIKAIGRRKQNSRMFKFVQRKYGKDTGLDMLKHCCIEK